MIDKNSPLPIYFQIEEQIKRQIENGEFQAHDALPSEREYAEQFEISRMTVRQAINNLVNDGYLYRQKGRGTFVADKKLEQQLNGLTSFTEDMKARGLNPSSKLLSFEIIPADKKIASELHISLYAPVYEIKRIRLADDVPMALETVYMSANLIKGLTEDIINLSLYQYVENYVKLKIDYASQTLESSIASELEVTHLAIPKNSPILFIQRNTFLIDGTPLEYVKSAYRADRYKFTINISR
ncbi:GntR family transcriptional regulator [Peribacillus frigoritolerans]|uniref:GntR family transcriptional regulator n=1 Tax=Peribacillus frigoritolerans TaxID=450367 RepID=UPI0019262D40|nr:GntR family transcriptional regulator [Bacillus sp. RHFB]MCK2005230.1 GntR family transcriptional regulator [Peribacillus frigoritolerans]MEE3955550.1 GntR family transcriptional regulator [Peribacillus frigoritolerans]